MKLAMNKYKFGLRLPIVIALVVLLLGVGAAAYYFLTKEDTPPTLNQQQNDECVSKVNDKDLCTFLSSRNENDSYTAMFSSTEGGEKSEMTIKNDGQGNSYTTTSIDGGQVNEMIILDGFIYSKPQGFGSWLKYPNEEPEESTYGLSDFDFDIDDMPTFKNEGKEACGSLSCFKYTITNKDATGSTYTIWFDDKDYKLRRVADGNDEASMEATYEYGSVTINEPSPVQDLSDLGSQDDAQPEQSQ